MAGSRVPDAFFVDEGAAMIVASTMVPVLTSSPCASKYSVASSAPPVACRPPHHSTAGTTTEDLFRDSLKKFLNVARRNPRIRVVHLVSHGEYSPKRPVIVLTGEEKINLADREGRNLFRG